MLNRRLKSSGLPILAISLLIISSAASGDDGASGNAASKRVLVLHSYHKGLTWTDGEETGIRDAFGIRGNLEVHTEYLDSKRMPLERVAGVFADYLSRKYPQAPFDAVITSDNNALTFLATYHGTMFPGIPVVFCGINNYAPEMLDPFDGLATGVIQALDPAGTIDLIQRLQPGVQVLAVVSGTTPTATAIKDLVAAEVARQSPPLEVLWFDGLDTKTLQARLADLSSDDAVLLCNFNRDANGVYYAHEAGARMICDHSPAPVYAMEDLYIGTGVVGGYMDSSVEQGSTAGRLCLELLETGRLPEVIATSPSKILIDFQAATARGLDVSLAPAEATVLNRPPSLYEEHKQFVWNAVLVFCLLSLALIGLTYGLLRGRAAAKQLSRNKERLRITLNSIGDAVIATDTAGLVTNMNPVAERLTGWTLAHGRGRHLTECFKIVNTVTGESALDPVSLVLKDGRTVGLGNHTQLLARDGREYQIADSAAPILDDDGRLDGVVLVFRDVTEEYRIQEDLQRALRDLTESESRLREAQEMASLGHWMWNVKTGGVTWSEEVYRIFERDPEEFTPQIDSIQELSPWPEDHQRDRELIDRAIASRERGSFEQRFLRPDGSTGYYFSTFQGVYDDEGNLTAIKGTVQDISERKHAEQALRESEERMELALQGADLGTWDWNVTTGVVSFDKRWAEMLGYESDELEPSIEAWSKLVHPDDLPAAQRSLNAHLEGRTDFYQIEHRLQHRSGEWIWVLNKARVTKYDNDNRQHLVGVGMDITERKRAEEALRESNRVLETLVANLPGFVYRCKNDRDWTMEYMRGCVQECTGYSADDFIANQAVSFNNIITEEHRDRLWELWQTRLSARAPLQTEYTIRHRDGTIKWVWEQGRGVFDENGELLALEGFISDISDRKKAEAEREALEAQLRQSQKMEAVGQLAGGVAHDFNNLLTAILGNVELGMDSVRTSLGDNHNVLQSMEQIEEAAQRASALTRQLLTFSRRDVVQPQILDLNVVLTNLEKMLRRLITENITLRLITRPDLSTVQAGAGQIEQVIVNLVVNAVHAMPDGGDLILEVRNVMLDQVYARDHVEGEPGPYVQLTVSDTGVGMDSEVLERIFEPFFTTKPVDKGTGLGLATVHGIVKRAGGHIRVYSEPQVGTTFKVYLPALNAAPAPSPPHEELVTTQAATETLLLCEDDPSVRELIAKSLQSVGYQVHSAGCGEEGLQVANEHDGPIHLLITDVIMPDMNGRALSEKLRDNHPSLPTLFISGYTANVIAHHGVLDKGVEFLEKPFTPKELLAKVRSVLDKIQAEAPR